MSPSAIIRQLSMAAAIRSSQHLVQQARSQMSQLPITLQERQAEAFKTTDQTVWFFAMLFSIIILLLLHQAKETAQVLMATFRISPQQEIISAALGRAHFLPIREILSIPMPC